MQRLTVTFRKAGSARFLSHLDLTAVFEYAVRRAHLPVALSEGFNPRPKISVAASLALGYVGEAELLEIVMREPVQCEDALTRLQACLPAGIELVTVDELPPNGRSAAARLQSADYRIELPCPVPDLSNRVAGLLAETSSIQEEVRDGVVRRRDIRPMISALECTSASSLRMSVTLDGGGSVRPDHILERLGVPVEGSVITRERLILAP